MKVVAIIVLAALAGCVGITDDYAKTAIGMSENASANTMRNLTQKHDLELRAYSASYCGQPRIGAIERRYRDPAHLHARHAMCEIERQLGFGM